jgi:hypothetical protein
MNFGPEAGTMFFENTGNHLHLSETSNLKNEVLDEIKTRISSGNACCYSLQSLSLPKH